MRKKNEITLEQKAEIEAARKRNKDKRIERRLLVLCMRADGKTLPEISAVTGYHVVTVSRIVSQYVRHGLAFMTQCHYLGNRRHMSVEQEAEVLKPFIERAQQGQVVSVQEIAQAYQKAVGHRVGPNQIYYVLKRQGWRKVMPRSRHPKKASDEAIAASKKLKAKSKIWESYPQRKPQNPQ
jgi:transposase